MWVRTNQTLLEIKSKYHILYNKVGFLHMEKNATWHHLNFI